MYMKRFLTIVCLAVIILPMGAQQLPDPHFENWTDKFNGDAQLKDWHGSNVSQAGLKFTLLYQKPGRTGNCAYVADKKVGAMGIKEVAPGYMSLGKPWQYMKGLNVKSATGGTEGGIAFKYRPDTMAVWIKRVGANTDKEDFHLLFYSWAGTAKNSKYTNKGGTSTTTERTNEECDIRTATDGNELGVDQPARQVAEGWIRKRAKYNEWTQVKVPIFYKSNGRPTMCNVIFSAGNYPAFRTSEGLFDGNGLYVDDVELIYSTRIDRMLVNGKEWKEFNPDSNAEQVLKVTGDKVEFAGLRGIGTLTNIKGERARFGGRKLDAQEMTVVPGEINGKPWEITVKADDGSASRTYIIKVEK